MAENMKYLLLLTLYLRDKLWLIQYIY